MLYRLILAQDCVKVWKTIRGVSTTGGDGGRGLQQLKAGFEAGSDLT
jgi:hypothetical protein